MAGEHRRAFQQVLAAALADPDAKLAITGATGWLGLALANMASLAGLTTANGRLRLLAGSPRAIALSGEAEATVEALTGAEPLLGSGWRVAHFAGHGKERTADLSPEQFAAAGDSVLAAAMALAARADQPRILFSSSGAVYGPDGLVTRLEDSPYGYLKRLHEARLQDWCGQRGLPLAIVRVFNIGGPYGNKRDSYALSSLVDATLAGGPITIRAERPVLRSYVHVEELLALMIALLDRPEACGGRPFDTAGSEVVEVGELADRIRRVLGRPDIPIERNFRPDLPADRYVGDSQVYQAWLKRLGMTPATLDLIIGDAAPAH